MDREGLAEKIIAMGGVHYNDLMSNVQYLIVGDRNTAKYKFCVRSRADMKFITQDAIAKLHDKWIKGMEMNDSAMSIDKNLMPVFENLNICVSRVLLDPEEIRQHFKPQEFREQGISHIQRIPIAAKDFFHEQKLILSVESNGGDALESLTLRHSCLVTSECEGRRYSKAKEWSRPILHPLWIFDSIVRGAAMVYEDYYYDPSASDSQYDSGCTVWNLVLDKRSRAADESEVPGQSKKKMRTTSAVWNSIMAPPPRPAPKIAGESAWKEDDEGGSDDGTENDAANTRIDVTRSMNVPNVGVVDTPSLEVALFNGLNFLCVGYEDKQLRILEKVILSRRGEVSHDANDDTVTHILIPASQGSQSLQILRLLPSPTKRRITEGQIIVVTEWFLERSMYFRLLQHDIWGKPIKGLLKHAGTPWKICVSGFTGVELLHLEKMIQYMGHTFCDSLSAERDLLVVNVQVFKASLTKNAPRLFQYKPSETLLCATLQAGLGQVLAMASKNKINAAKRWKVPIVLVAFLWEALRISLATTHTDVLIMPNVADLSWCVYAPSRYTKPHSILDYVKSMESTHDSQLDQTQNPGESVERPRAQVSPDTKSHLSRGEGSPSETVRKRRRELQLPSPRKPKHHQKYGPIAGSSTGELLQARLIQESELALDHECNDADITNEEPMTQVRYESS